MKFFDTFSGIGGFSLPLTELGHECIGFSEIDKFASQVYLSHFPSHHPYGDITKLDAATLPDFDLLVGGFPCQAFSVAGKRRGFLDTRGTLFFDLCRIAKEKRPRLLLFENVKGLLNHAGGETFRVIVSALDELGYDLQWQVLNSRYFGVPQNRERVFIVGHLRGTPRPEVFPLRDGNCENRQEDSQQTDGLYAGTLRLKNQAGPCLFDSGTALATYPAPTVNRPSVAVYDDYNGNIRKDGLTGTLTPNTGSAATRNGQKVILDNISIRRFTPVECERLQGFHDGWTAGVSDTQRYKCLGNAVTVNVVREIVKQLV